MGNSLDDAVPLAGSVQRLLSRAVEVTAVVDRQGVAMVEARLTPLGAVLTKALGLVRSDPWMSGGSVDIGAGADRDGRNATVRWRSGTGLIADRWSLRRDGFSLDPPPADGTRGGRGLQQVSGYSAVVWLPSLTSAPVEARGPLGRLWGLLPVGPEPVLRWQRVAEDGLAGKSATASVDPAPLSRPDKVIVKEAVVAAVQRSRNDWQALLWLDSPTVIDDLSVRLEIPRAAVLSSASDPSWLLPAETAARRLNARITHSTTSGGAGIRSMSARATLALQKDEQSFHRWALGLEPNTIAAWVDPGALAVWLEAVAKMEEGVLGSSLRRGSGQRLWQWLRPLGQDTALGRAWSRLGPVQLVVESDALSIGAAGRRKVENGLESSH